MGYGKKVLFLLLFVGGLTSIYLFFLFQLKPEILNADAYYHFALSKIQWDLKGIPSSLPQLGNLKWNLHFVDKEFFYHLLTTLAWGIGKEKAIQILTIMLGISLYIILYLFSLKQFKSHFMATLLSSFIVTSHFFLFRLTMVRALSLSIPLFILLWVALLLRKWRVMALMFFLFPLSYHAFYLPLVALVAVFFLYPNYYKKIIFWGVIPFALGIVLNPFFPEVLRLGVEHLLYVNSWGSSISSHELATELQFPPLQSFWAMHLFFLSFLILGVTQFSHWIKLAREKSGDRSPLIMFLIGGLFYLLMFVNYRTMEYTYPLILVSFAVCWPSVQLSLATKKIMPFFLLVLNFLHIIVFFQTDPKDEVLRQIGFFKKVQSDLSQLAVYPKGKIVNCSWSIGSAILYQLPQFSFVDLLDPNFLLKENKNLYRLRESVRLGNALDPYKIIVHDFKGQYYLCHYGQDFVQLEFDPRFKRIYPTDFSVNIDLHSSQILRNPGLLIYQVNDNMAQKWLKPIWVMDNKNWKSVEHVERSAFVFSKFLKSLKDRNGCVTLKVEEKGEDKNFYLTIGGNLSDSIDVIYNNQKLNPLHLNSFNAGKWALINKIYKITASKNGPITVKIKLCDDLQSESEMAFALSLWSEREIKGYCVDRLNSPLLRLMATFGYSHPLVSLSLCDFQ